MKRISVRVTCTWCRDSNRVPSPRAAGPYSSEQYVHWLLPSDADYILCVRRWSVQSGWLSAAAAAAAAESIQIVSDGRSNSDARTRDRGDPVTGSLVAAEVSRTCVCVLYGETPSPACGQCVGETFVLSFLDSLNNGGDDLTGSRQRAVDRGWDAYRMSTWSHCSSRFCWVYWIPDILHPL